LTCVPPFASPITELVPHRASMLLVERVLAQAPEVVRVETTVRRGALFAAEDGWPSWVGVELMAQAVSSWAGLRARAAGEPVPLGFLLGTRRYRCARPSFRFGTRLEIEARLELAAGTGMRVFACTIEDAGEVLATANLNVYQPPDVEAYLRRAGHG
jgi:predicted hotdog family 3-hydroxylacyl-ACP dehydratase